jgi:hypothetical protein
MISPPAPDTNQQMHAHAKLSIYAETCVHALSSRYWPTFKDAPSALKKCRNVPDCTHAQTNAGTLSALDTFKRMRPHPHSPQCVQTHAETCLALKKRKHTQIHAWPLIRAARAPLLIRSAPADTRTALDTGNWIKIHAPLLKHANKFSALEPHADKRSDLDTSWWMETHTHLLIWTNNTHADTCSALDTSRLMQKSGKLGIRAYTYQAFNTCMYMHTFNTCGCRQSHNLDECRIIHVKYERANMDGDWEGKHEWNNVISYAAHDYEPSMLTYADLPSMYLLCKSLYTVGFAQGTNIHFLSQRRDLCSNLEIIQGPAERSLIMKRQLKTQEDTLPKNILRSVHRLSLLARTFEHEVWAHIIFSHRKSVNR